jgi:transcription initiation factor TFIIB|uniref:Cyclin-like domain-containing protein n=1 Tax=viral metagenome TaxID=1070528 RepID=A0A6C0JAF0_9ZZZZ
MERDTERMTKRQRKKPLVNKDMWNLFDEEMGKTQVECVYLSSKNRECCDSCNASVAITEDGFLECTNKKCSIIYKDIIDSTAEWRFYGADDNHGGDPTRCGMPINPLLKESSYGCKVICKSNTSYEMRKIKRYTDWHAMPYKEKSQYDEFQRITTLSQTAGIPKLIIDDALRYHKKVSEHQTFRGLNRHGIIAASIYISCRVNGTPRTAKEIATIFHLDNASATKGCKNATSIINIIEEDMDTCDKTILCQTNPISFIERYCSRISMTSELTKLCRFIAKKIEQNKYIPENTPNSIAAGIVYFVTQVCHVDVNRKTIHTVSGISEVTINKCFKKLEALDEHLIPNAIRRKYC